MLTTDQFLAICVDRNGSQNEAFHHISRNQGSNDEPVVPWVLLLALVEDLGDFCFLPVLRHLSWSPQPFKDDPD